MWCLAGLLHGLALLPFRARIRLGEALGRPLLLGAGRRRRIARTNLRLCYPDLDEPEREALLLRHFRELGVALVEMGAAWWAPSSRLGPFRVQGMEHVQAALAEGRGVIMLSAHFLCTEVGLRLMGPHQTGSIIYRPHNNPLMDHVVQGGRERHGGVLIDRSDFRTIIGTLRDNQPLWFPADQDHGPRHSVFAPLFGVPAATLTAVSRLAKLSGSPVVPYFTYRLPGTQGYEALLLPRLEDFPSADLAADAARVNRILEEQIRAHPEQWVWIHRRFKTRPPGEPSPYAVAASAGPDA